MSKTIYNPNCNLLFSLSQLESCKYNEKILPVRCIHCGKIFLISKRQYNRFISHKCTDALKFCCKQCEISFNKQHCTSIAKPCQQCGKLVTKAVSEAKRHPNFFCNRSCAAKYNNAHRTHQHSTKTKTKRVLKRCKICGGFHDSHNPKTSVCSGNWLQTHSSQLKLQQWGFDTTTLGTNAVFQAYNDFKRLVEQLYFDNHLSQSDIAKKWGIPCSSTISYLFRWLGIQPLSQSQSTINAIKMKNIVREGGFNQFKRAYHTTWNNKRVFCRSSYEIDCCNWLDSQKIDYQMESLKIEYFNTKKNRNAIAIPDFYVPADNMIIEVKGTFTYDYQEMVDKSTEYKRLGYRFLLILDHQQYDYCPQINKKTISDYC